MTINFKKAPTIIGIIVSVATLYLGYKTYTLDKTTQKQQAQYNKLNNKFDQLERSPHFVMSVNDLQSPDKELISINNESTSKLQSVRIYTKTFIFASLKMKDEYGIEDSIPLLFKIPLIDDEIHKNAVTTGQLASFELTADRETLIKKNSEYIGFAQNKETTNNISNDLKSINIPKNDIDNYKKEYKEQYITDFQGLDPYIGIITKADIYYKTLGSNKTKKSVLIGSSKDLIDVYDKKILIENLNDEYKTNDFSLSNINITNEEDIYSSVSALLDRKVSSITPPGTVGMSTYSQTNREDSYEYKINQENNLNKIKENRH